jgi:hypothetical protein
MVSKRLRLTRCYRATTFCAFLQSHDFVRPRGTRFSYNHRLLPPVRKVLANYRNDLSLFRSSGRSFRGADSFNVRTLLLRRRLRLTVLDRFFLLLCLPSRLSRPNFNPNLQVSNLSFKVQNLPSRILRWTRCGGHWCWGGYFRLQAPSKFKNLVCPQSEWRSSYRCNIRACFPHRHVQPIRPVGVHRSQLQTMGS